MRKVIVLLGVAILMAVTNPSVADFETYIKNTIYNDAQRSSDGFTRFVGMAGSGFAAQIAAANVRRNDYFLVSVFAMNIDRPRMYVGVFKFFIPIN
jgi:hypothetical protein